MFVLWIIGLILIGAAIFSSILFSKTVDKKKLILIRTVASILGVLLIIVGSTIRIIPTGYTGVRTTFGQISQKTVPNGFTIKAPIVQKIITINNKQQDTSISTQIWGETIDKTPVFATDVRISYRVSNNKSSWIVANISNSRHLIDDSTVASAIKSAMVELTVEEVTNRTKIEPLVKEKLINSFTEKYGKDTIIINKVVINNMDFEESYNKAIAEKSIAKQTQEKQAIENKTAIDKAEAEANAKLIKAEAEANANKKIQESLTNDILKNKSIEKWDGKLPVVSGDSGTIVDVGSLINSSKK